MADLTAQDLASITTIQLAISRTGAVERFEQALAAQACYVKALQNKYGEGIGNIPFNIANNSALSPDEKLRLQQLNTQHQGSIANLVSESERAAKQLNIEDREAGNPPMSLSLRAVNNITSSFTQASCMELSSLQSTKRPSPRAPIMGA